MKTPEENKCGLECIRSNTSRICVKTENGQCPRCEQLVEESLVRIHKLESTYSQVSKALCGKKNATLEELLQAVSQVKSRLAQVERERDALMYYAKGCCTTCAFRDDCAKHDLNDSSPYGERWYYGDCEDWEWRGVCEENTKDD